jgi:hypothetical protein
MNANEVVANRALEHLGHGRGRYDVLHPNDHVNASQSTHDVYPTALHVAAWHGIKRLIAAMAELRGSFERWPPAAPSPRHSRWASCRPPRCERCWWPTSSRSRCGW